MSNFEADRNLLFGFLALQNDFISREELIAATSAWLQDKSRPLDRILLDRNSLPDDEHALLTALVKKHLEKHDNDPEKSLAAISSIGSVREELKELGDPQVEATLSRVSEVSEESAHYATQMVSVGEATSEGSRFRILRPHARGGLGQVLVARDEELHREVALKEILGKHADNPNSRSRFIVEAEITGGLEHPGIVPVYGLGQYADGRPYYAMRLIRGDSLKEAIQRFHAKELDGRRNAGERMLELRQLLGRFVDVCNAIEYAHSRGVLHRDLKPGNIMLGKYGETLVVDWGLAKSGAKSESFIDSEERTLQPSSASGSAPTQMGSAIGTPQYMPPEQAEGRLERMGPASDVYSLGATLYCLLTGKAPFQDREVETILKKVKLGEFRPPREVNPHVPLALQAICLKAMATRPDDRYPTVLPLIDDLEHWMADEPVTAWREPLPARVGRWIRKHQALVTGSAAAAAVALITLSLGIALLAAAKQREQKAKDEAVSNYEESVRQRQKAEKNFQLAQSAVDSFFTQVSEDTLLNQSGMQPLRRELLSEALQYYRAFLDERGDDASLRHETAAAIFRVGRIVETIDAPSDALAPYEKARLQQQEIVRNDPDDHVSLAALGTTWNAIGRVQTHLQNFDEAMAAYEEAEAIRSRLVREHGDVGEYHRLLANSHMNIGAIEQRRGNMVEAKERFQRAQVMRQLRIGQGDQDPKLRRDLGKGYWNLATFALAMQDGAAEEKFQAAISVFEKLLDEDRHNLDNQSMLALCYRMLGDEQSTRGDWETVIQTYGKARPLMENLAIRNPNVPQFQASLAGLHMNLGEVQRRQGRSEDALLSFKSARRILDPLADQYPETPNHRRDFAVTLRAEATLLVATGQMPQARANLDTSQKTLRALVNEFPEHADFQEQLKETESAIQQLPDK